MRCEDKHAKQKNSVVIQDRRYTCAKMILMSICLHAFATVRCLAVKVVLHGGGEFVPTLLCDISGSIHLGLQSPCILLVSIFDRHLNISISIFVIIGVVTGCFA